MSVKVKLGEVINAVETKAFARLANAEGLSFKAAYDAAKLVKRAQAEYDTAMEARNKLVKEHGEPDGDKFSIKPDSEAMSVFVREFAVLLDSEVELDVTPVQLPVPSENKCDLRPIDMVILAPFVKLPG